MNKLVLFTLFLIEVPLFSQGKDVIYLDIGIIIFGTEENYGIGINYERMLNNYISFRTGLNYSIDIRMRSSSQMILGLPVGFNFFTGGNKKLEFRLGSGGMIFLNHKADKFSPGVILGLGYRYQKKNEEGRFFKTGFEIPCNRYISLFGGGYCY